ncbi:MAG: hypothetical protein HGA44_19470 [Cellulomonadaceae bacterium]|nr:hypothetical protein [Cellulomonadaceae bacterium]
MRLDEVESARAYAKGLPPALKFIAATAGAAGTAFAITALWNATHDGADPTEASPDCNYRSESGACLDDDPSINPEPAPDPEPEPGAAGGGIKLPGSCLSDDAGNQLREAWMENGAVQDHHLATNKSQSWTPRFNDLLNEYFGGAVTLDQPWNHTPMVQRGNHSPEYHRWVFENMQKAAEESNGDPEVFKDLFERWVTVRVSQVTPSSLAGRTGRAGVSSEATG